jgi:hypothetical protein
MLKAFTDLEKAVNRLMENAGKAESQEPVPGGEEISAEEISISLQSAAAAPDTEEAAELIRRAIKRLKSL